MHKELLVHIRPLVEHALTEHLVDLVDMTIKSDGRGYNIEILADKPEGGITIDVCAELNRVIGDQLEQDVLLDRAFTVNVSSPGVDRPLRIAKDFRRVIGRAVRVHLNDKIEDKIEHMGTVKTVTDDMVTLEAKAGLIDIPFIKINKAIQVI